MTLFRTLARPLVALAMLVATPALLACGDDASSSDGEQTSGPIARITIGSDRYEGTPFCVQEGYLSVTASNTGEGPTIVLAGRFGIEGAGDSVVLSVSGIDEAGTVESYTVQAASGADAAIGAFGEYSFDVASGTASGEAEFEFFRGVPGSGQSEQGVVSGSFEFRCD